jgi:putative Mn2+ efflux pump MntP
MTAVVLAALLALSAALSVDNVAAGLSLGLRGRDATLRLRVLAAFGAVGLCAPLVGLAVGSAAAQTISGRTGWVVGGLILLAVGLYDIWLALAGRGERRVADVRTSLRRLVSMAVSVSLDSVASGVALGMEAVPYIASILVIATVTTAMTMLGLEFGGRLSRRLGERFERDSGPIAALVLVMVGVGMVTGIIR